MELPPDHGHRFTEWRAINGRVYPIDRALKELQAMPYDAWFRYSNPFEQKWALADRQALPPGLAKLMRSLEDPPDPGLFGVDLLPDHDRYFSGVFRYDQGDYLMPHVDAGVWYMPDGTFMRKRATIILYLGSGDGMLDFWMGNDCADSAYPKIFHPSHSFAPTHGHTLLFENNDYAWHGARRNYSYEPRYVVTVSFMSKIESPHDDIKNQRTHAYFVPYPWQSWDSDVIRMRNLRAAGSPESYRVI